MAMETPKCIYMVQFPKMGDPQVTTCFNIKMVPMAPWYDAFIEGRLGIALSTHLQKALPFVEGIDPINNGALTKNTWEKKKL